MTHKKRVLLSLTLPGAVVQPLALEPGRSGPAHSSRYDLDR
jgi:hypothetical protein